MGEFDGVELDDLVLSGPRLTLRPWVKGDAAAVFDIMQDRSMHQFLSLADPYTRETAGNYVVKDGHEGRREGSGIGSAVVETATGKLVASTGLRLPSGLRTTTEIGYWVAAEARGNGYAAEATDILCRWAFEHRVQRVEVYCDILNIASAAAALRAGFTFEGIQRDAIKLHGGYRADAGFARLATDSGEPVAWSFPRLREPLTDGTITLRPVNAEDVQPILESFADPLSVSVGFTGTVDEPEATRARVERLALQWLVGSSAHFAIEDVETERYAGEIQLRKVGPPHVAGIGYEVHPAFRGRGYTTRALRLLSQWAFSEAGYVRLELGAKSHNVASQKAALAAGFTREGTSPSRLRNPDGSFSDEFTFYLLADQPN